MTTTRHHLRRWLLPFGGGLLLGLLGMLGMLGTASAEAQQIVGDHNQISQPEVTSTVITERNAIAMPHLSAQSLSTSVITESNAIQVPNLDTTSTSAVVTGSNAIQVPKLRTSSLGTVAIVGGSSEAAIRTPALTVEAITGLDVRGETRIVGLPTTGAGLPGEGGIPTVLILLLLGLAMAALGLAVRVQRQIVPPQRPRHSPGQRRLVTGANPILPPVALTTTWR